MPAKKKENPKTYTFIVLAILESAVEINNDKTFCVADLVGMDIWSDTDKTERIEVTSTKEIREGDIVQVTEHKILLEAKHVIDEDEIIAYLAILKAEGNTVEEAVDKLKLDFFVKTGGLITATMGKDKFTYNLMTIWRTKRYFTNKIFRNIINSYIKTGLGIKKYE